MPLHKTILYNISIYLGSSNLMKEPVRTEKIITITDVGVYYEK
jgi:hypothetical protein